MSHVPISPLIASKPTETLGLDMPSSMIIPMITAVPASVIIQLMNTKSRSSVRAQFDAGNTPAWYKVGRLVSRMASEAGGIHMKTLRSV